MASAIRSTRCIRYKLRVRSPIGEQTGDQEDNRIYRQKIVYKGVDFACANDNPNEPNHCQTDADQRCGNGEDMDANVGFELALWRLLEPRVLIVGLLSSHIASHRLVLS